MDEIISLIRPFFPYIVVGLGIYLLVRFGAGFIKSWGEGLGATVSGTVPAIAIMVAVGLAVFGAIAIWQPTFWNSFFSSRGPFGPDRLIAETKADLISVILEPAEDANQWKSASAKAAASALTSEYELAEARNRAAIQQARTEANCYGVSVENCEKSLSPREQVAKKAIAEVSDNTGKTIGEVVAKVDLDATSDSLSRPFGTPPVDAPNEIKAIYQIPKGFWYGLALVIVLLVAMSGLAKFMRSLWGR